MPSKKQKKSTPKSKVSKRTTPTTTRKSKKSRSSKARSNPRVSSAIGSTISGVNFGTTTNGAEKMDFNIKKLLNDSCQQRSKTKLKKRKKRLSLSLVFPLSSLQERGVKEFVEKSEASPRPCTCRRGSRLRVDCLGFILSKGRFGKGRRHVRCSLSLFTFSLFVARARDLVPCVPSSSLDARSLLLRLSSPAAALLVVGPCSSRSRAGSPRRPSCSS